MFSRIQPRPSKDRERFKKAVLTDCGTLSISSTLTVKLVKFTFKNEMHLIYEFNIFMLFFFPTSAGVVETEILLTGCQ